MLSEVKENMFTTTEAMRSFSREMRTKKKKKKKTTKRSL
jgi:hypothetical protein